MNDRPRQLAQNAYEHARERRGGLHIVANGAGEMQGTSEQVAACPMDGLLQLLSSSWTTAILWTLQRDGAQRFGVLRRKIPGISARLLTARLRRLMEAGMVVHSRCDAARAERRYALSARGDELGALFASLHAVVQRWAAEDCVPPD